MPPNICRGEFLDFFRDSRLLYGPKAGFGYLPEGIIGGREEVTNLLPIWRSRKSCPKAGKLLQNQGLVLGTIICVPDDLIACVSSPWGSRGLQARYIGLGAGRESRGKHIMC